MSRKKLHMAARSNSALATVVRRMGIGASGDDKESDLAAARKTVEGLEKELAAARAVVEKLEQEIAKDKLDEPGSDEQEDDDQKDGEAGARLSYGSIYARQNGRHK